MPELRFIIADRLPERELDYLKQNIRLEPDLKLVVTGKNNANRRAEFSLFPPEESVLISTDGHIISNMDQLAILGKCGLNAGYIGPVGLKINGDAIVLYDRSLENRNNLSCGANEDEYHYKGLDMQRDVPDAEYHDFAKAYEGGICPKCGKKTIRISRGIEVGNIFQLGDKYTKAMKMTYVDQNGESKTPIMGCYGIGVGRLAAAVCEAHHDEYGPIWPKSIAPWQVHLCAVRADNEEVRKFADDLYEKLQEIGIEVIYDDRTVSAGVMFSDADLLGVPLRVIVSPRNMKQGVIEVVSRDKTLQTQVKMEEAAEQVKKYL